MTPWYLNLIEPTDHYFSHHGTMMNTSVNKLLNVVNSPALHSIIVKNEELDSRICTAYITDKILDIHYYVEIINFIESMNENDKIVMYFDSGGGYVSTGSTIASSLVHAKGTSIGIARGLCCSSASYMWSACKYQVAEPLSVLMYHMSSHSDMGNSIDIMNRASAMVDYVVRGPLAIAKEKGHLLDSEIDEIVKGRTNVYISAKEMNKRLAERKRQIEESVKIEEGDTNEA